MFLKKPVSAAQGFCFALYKCSKKKLNLWALELFLGQNQSKIALFYTVLNSPRSFWQHFSDSIFVVATFEDLTATKPLSEYIYASLKVLCMLVYWIKKIVMKGTFHSKSCDLKECW